MARTTIIQSLFALWNVGVTYVHILIDAVRARSRFSTASYDVLVVVAGSVRRKSLALDFY